MIEPSLGVADLLDSLLSKPEFREKLARAMATPILKCPVCGENYVDLVAHCDEAGDPDHLAASVIES